MQRTKVKLRKIRRRAGIHDAPNDSLSFIDIFYQYASYSKINGMYYLTRGVTSGFIRWLWIAIIISIMMFGGVLTMLVMQDFFEIPTLMTREAPALTHTVPFPAVTICSANTIIDHKANVFVNRILLPDGATKDDVKDALLILSAFTERQMEEIRPEHITLVDNVLKLNNMTIMDAVESTGLGCTDFIKRFSWGASKEKCQDKNCAQFTQSLSYLGICCSINYHALNSTSTPFTINYFGIGSGLSIILSHHHRLSDGISGALNSEGLLMLVHHPNIFPSEASRMFLLKPGRENLVAVYPIITTCASNVLDLSPHERKCIHPGDNVALTYGRTMCERQCLIAKIHNICGCHPYNLPEPNKITQIRMCNVSDAVCFAKNFWNFKNRKCEHCLPACSEISYRISSYRTNLMENGTYSIRPFFANFDPAQGDFTTNIYFARQTVFVQKKILVLSWITLLASFGGIFNLSSGMSILAVFEFLFCFGSQLFRYFWRKYSMSQKLNRIFRKN